jgi:DNA polymerase-3 subunit alpha
VLDRAVKLVGRRGIDLDLSNLPLDDKKSYDLLAHGEAVGVFQVESAGMRRALIDMRPDRIEDLIALVALYRPGPMANIPTYCARKHALEQPDYIHPKLEPILRETYGVIVYQEQVMQAAQVLSGFSLGEADLLRRAMGKKIRSEMKAQRDRFVSGAIERGVEAGQAGVIFDLLERFADYGFNKSHAAAYALVAYQTAYMKANYPVEFLAASMTLAMGNTDKLAEFRAEAERLAIKVEPPSINRSDVEFEVAGNTIRYALAALRGVGRQAVEAILAARAERPFADLADFARRVNPRAVNKRVLESLVAAGAFDAMEANRARIFAVVDTILATAQRAHDNAALGQSELFGGATAAGALALPAIEPWLPAERLQREYEAVGFFLSGHPLDDYAAALKRLRVQPWSDFSRAVKAGAGTPGPFSPPRTRPAPAPAASPGLWCRVPNGAPRTAPRWALSVCPTRAATTRRCCSRKAWPSIATCWNLEARCSCFSPPRSRATRCAPASNRSSRSTRPRRQCRRDCACSCATARRSKAWHGASSRSTCARAGTAAIAATARSRWC